MRGQYTEGTNNNILLTNAATKVSQFDRQTFQKLCYMYFLNQDILQEVNVHIVQTKSCRNHRTVCKNEKFTSYKRQEHKILNIPNHACCSPCTSIAKPKSASLTAAPFCLLANNKFSGYGRKSEKQQQKNVLMICQYQSFNKLEIIHRNSLNSCLTFRSL